MLRARCRECRKNGSRGFRPDIPPEISHAPSIREEAFEWLDTNFPGVLAFPNIKVLGMAGEQDRRWLITRFQGQGIGEQKEFSQPATADALAILFLHSNGVKFRDAVDAAIGGGESPTTAEPRYGGVWNRLIDIALKRIRRRITSRLLGSVVFSLLRDAKDQPNCLVIVKRLGPAQADEIDREPQEGVIRVCIPGHTGKARALLLGIVPIP